jgi:uncharacterized protein (TIGR03086 family)
MIHGLHHVGISVPDMAEAERFYMDVLGFTEAFAGDWDRTRPEADRVIGLDGTSTEMKMLRGHNAYIELWCYRSPEPRPMDPGYSPADHGITHFCLQVSDIDMEFERLGAAGMTFHGPPVTLGENRSIYGRDPFGNIIELYQVTGENALPSDAVGRSDLQAFVDALALFDGRVAPMSTADFAATSPCDGWNAGDVVDHVVANLHGLAAGVDGEDFFTGVARPVDADRTTAWTDARAAGEAAVTRALAHDVTALKLGEREVTTDYLVEALMRDMVIHTWDLARSTGSDDSLPADLVAAATGAMEAVTEELRGPGMYGPVVTTDDDADAQTRLLALSGRQV